MSAKNIAAPFPPLVEASPLARVSAVSFVRWLFNDFAREDAAERALAVEERIALGSKKLGRRTLPRTEVSHRYPGDTIGPVVKCRAPIRTRPAPVRRSARSQEREA